MSDVAAKQFEQRIIPHPSACLFVCVERPWIEAASPQGHVFSVNTIHPTVCLAIQSTKQRCKMTLTFDVFQRVINYPLECMLCFFVCVEWSVPRFRKHKVHKKRFTNLLSSDAVRSTVDPNKGALCFSHLPTQSSPFSLAACMHACMVG